MGNGRLASLIILALVLVAGLYLFVSAAVAMPSDTIKGFVLDKDGNPVPYANVSLWQDGKLVPCSMGNPQQSRFTDMLATIPSSREYVGMFWFGMLSPGEYTIRAERWGHTGTASVNVTPVEVHYAFVANVTLPGYQTPAFTPAQLNLTGGIAGTIKGVSGLRWSAGNVSLLHNGEMVEIPGNPQPSRTQIIGGREADYLFEHLTPGRYEVVVEYYGLQRELQYERQSVNVSNGIATADIVLSNLLVTSPPPPPDLDAPTPPPSPSSTAGFDLLPVLASIGVAILLFSRLRKAG